MTVVNSSAILDTCGDKLFTTLKLEAAGLPVIRWMATLTPEGALPSWRTSATRRGQARRRIVRLASRLDGHDAQEAVLEHRDALPGPVNKITYVQEYIDKPGREIRRT